MLSAGEIWIREEKEGPLATVTVGEVTNQSTGYCPEPESWPALAAALEAAGVAHPGGFTTEFVFRLCPACGQRNIVKEGVFECGVCGGKLDAEWNF